MISEKYEICYCFTIHSRSKQQESTVRKNGPERHRTPYESMISGVNNQNNLSTKSTQEISSSNIFGKEKYLRCFGISSKDLTPYSEVGIPC